MALSPGKDTVTANMKKSLEPSMTALDKIAKDAVKKNKDDENAKALQTRMTGLKDRFDELVPLKTAATSFTALRNKLREAMTAFPKLAKLVMKPEDTKVAVTVAYANSKVQSACGKDSNCAARIKEVANHGPGYIGHKAVNAIKAQGHVHVGDKNGIAFSWKGATLTIVGYGTKNNDAKAGLSGYDWVT